MRLIKCPNCQGKGEYDLEQCGIITPVKCSCQNGKITWAEYCSFRRKQSIMHPGVPIHCTYENNRIRGGEFPRYPTALRERSEKEQIK